MKKINTTTVIFTLAGATAGLLYFEFYGCTRGCMISSVWWRSGLYGALMGFLIGGMVKDRLAVKTKPE